MNPLTYGFQFRAGTRWNSGLSEEQIDAYQADLEMQFPDDLKAFLRVMNGTDLPTVNVYGSSGEPRREGLGVYSYPRDIEHVRSSIVRANLNREVLAETLAGEGFDLMPSAKFIPIYAHRYVVSDEDPRSSVVLSIWDSEDAIV